MKRLNSANLKSCYLDSLMETWCLGTASLITLFKITFISTNIPIFLQKLMRLIISSFVFYIAVKYMSVLTHVIFNTN